MTSRPSPAQPPVAIRNPDDCELAEDVCTPLLVLLERLRDQLAA